MKEAVPKESSDLSGGGVFGLFLASFLFGPVCSVLGGVIAGFEYSLYLVMLLAPAGLVLGPVGLMVGLGLARKAKDPQLQGVVALGVAVAISLGGPALFMGAKRWPKQLAHRYTLYRAGTDEAYLRDIINRYNTTVYLTSAEGTALSIACEKRNGIPADMVPVLLAKMPRHAATVARIVRYQIVPAAKLQETFLQYSADKWENRAVWNALVENANTPEDVLIGLTEVNDPRVAYSAKQQLAARRARH